MSDSPFRRDPASLLRRLVDNVPSMLAYWDTELLCCFANRAYERWFGVKPDALVGTSIRDLLGSRLFALNEPYIRAALRGEEQLFERVVPGPGGINRHSLANYVPDVVDGVVRGFFVVVTETTKLKEAEAALRASENKFRVLTEASPFAIFRTDAEGRCTYTNPRWQETSGLSHDQSLDRGWIDALHPDDRQAVVAAWTQAVAEGQGFKMDFRLRRPDGEIRFVQAQARKILRVDGADGGFVGALEDVTERRLAEQRLRISEVFLDQAGQVAGVGGWALDLRTQVVTWSERIRQICEVGQDFQPTLQGWLDLQDPESLPMITAAMERAITEGVPWDMERPFLTAKGRPIWVRSFGKVEHEQGVPVRLIGALQDITEHRQSRVDLLHEQVLRAETERHAQDLNRVLHERNEMLDVLAHEVRQPLNNASAALQSAAAALSEVGEPVASQRLTRAQAVMGQVLASIDNTLAVASLLARPEPIHREDSDIDTVLAMAIADVPASERIRVQTERSTDTRTASMDMSLMRLALRNLLANALRYSPAGLPVVIRVSDSDDPLAMVIDVADSGPGIPADRVPTLFERGVRGAHSGAASGGGMGLGLYIVRRVMELHGGQALLVRNGPDGVTVRLVIQPLADD